ncbi:RsmF rRNA methyltransferase first C-terminal domain-containing protein [Butyrivibrio sp. YAB3001]|uniref:RsmF rRNA methyltransferase first C-terminal domain-containing protein n=1 Tax=Butyrivibrio sp. YAB3001 TaxID=1520812 RepID=UPI0008F62C7A|nr:RsmF rRNA methyltransferase first C-terminal domain-containing protein [Butyrivibrio sp. YAB3001]SFC36098.1 NOL1/NOP2/sun family putative RNA methylase [Butyrivibrio sp. YAB3001]
MLPELFCDRMKNLLSDKEYESFIESFGNDQERYHALRINTLKADEGFEEKVEGLLEKVRWEENGYYYDNAFAPGKSPFHEAGMYYIQEPSAMAPVHYLDPQPGEKILDLCAAPGGKTTQIADRMKGRGILVTNEINRERAKILSLNVERLGIRNALVLNETPQHLSQIFEGYFDRILVDAPCSGEGMFRKNEEAYGEWSLENVKQCGLRQAEILEGAARMLMPGGTLVFSTCTFAPIENEESIFRFILKHPDFSVQKVELFEGMANGNPDWVSDECRSEFDVSLEKKEEALSQVGSSIRLWPHKLKGEGHFLCVLKREGERLNSVNDKFVPGGKNPTAKKDVIRIFWEFAKETFSFSDEDKKVLKSGRSLDGNIISFGDQLYLADPLLPSISGLKVMRPGLHLGTIKKDRFEPSHALALALEKQDVKNTESFAADSDEIRMYLNGQTIRVDGEASKGWTLITADGYSIGWAKAAGGMLKNHYPKGLRINY